MLLRLSLIKPPDKLREKGVALPLFYFTINSPFCQLFFLQTKALQVSLSKACKKGRNVRAEKKDLHVLLFYGIFLPKLSFFSLNIAAF